SAGNARRTAETKAAEQNTAALHSKNKQKPKRQSKTLPHSTAKTNRNQSGRAKHCRTPQQKQTETKAAEQNTAALQKRAEIELSRKRPTIPGSDPRRPPARRRRRAPPRPRPRWQSLAT